MVARMKHCAIVGVGFQSAALAWLVAVSLGACGAEAAAGSKPSAAPPVEPASNAHDAAAPRAVAAPAGVAPSVEPEPEATGKAAADPPPKDPNATRDIKYVVTPEGLKITVAGVRFLASATAKQVGQGWGARVTVKAEVADAKEHVLLNPKNGPLAFAAAVFKKGSTEAERIPDEREGDAELQLTSAAPSTFSRDFPAKGGRVLAIGETLDLEVALWGLGESKDDRRPVKQFFHVKMKVDKGKPKALVEPPASASQ